ncbi:MAG: hypothetical protein LBG46_02580 [Elusimicrobiota bacterium]|jgi:ADP-heptose:LPS heptosyltransferase|nr:hypothetical protein [Elusimicrobiota bacterium]
MAINIKNINSILIFRSDGGLGDEIIYSILYRELKKANPAINISVATFGASGAFLKENKYINRLYVMPMRRLHKHSRWPTLIYYGLKIRKDKFDLAIDTSYKKNYPNWKLFSKIASRDKVREIKWISSGNHAKDSVIGILETLGVKDFDNNYDVHLTEKSQDKNREFLTANGIKEYIALNPFAHAQGRTFNAETLQLIASTLNQLFDKPQIVIPYMSRKQMGKIKNLHDNFANVYFFKTENPFDLISLIYSAKLLISPDTSAVHIASAFKKPTIAFYNKPWDTFWSPNNPNAIVVKAGPEPDSVNIFNIEEFKLACESTVLSKQNF